MDCISQAGWSLGTSVFNFSQVLIDGIATVTGLKFLIGAVQDSWNMLIGKEMEALRGEAMAYLSLDWEVFKKAMPIILPRLLSLLMNLIPLPPFLINWAQGGMRLISKAINYYTFYHNYVHVLIDLITTFWYCYRGAGDCCYPQDYKDRWSAAVEKKAKGQTKGFAESIGDTLNMAGRRVFGALLSDERVKVEMMSTDIVVSKIRIRLYSLRPDFLERLQLKHTKPLPKWIREMKNDASFWSHQLFFGVSAQEVQKYFPKAVKQYCLSTRRKYQNQPRCVKYILISRLPQNLKYALQVLNDNLHKEKISTCYNCLKFPF